MDQDSIFKPKEKKLKQNYYDCDWNYFIAILVNMLKNFQQSKLSLKNWKPKALMPQLISEHERVKLSFIKINQNQQMKLS